METSDNSSSSKADNNAFTETMNTVVDEFYEFNELINHNLKIESDIEKQLEKEDKKCTVLKHTIENLKQQLEDDEKISNEHRKYIFDQQMELEQISTTIYEQMEQLRIGYPQEDLDYHSEMVNVVQQMFQCVKNFKDILQNDVDECIRQGAEKNYWKNTSEQLMHRICELKASKMRLLTKFDELKNHKEERSPEDLKKRIKELQEIRNECKSMEDQLTDIKAQKMALIEHKRQIISESEKLESSSLSNYENYDQLNNLCADQINTLRAEIVNADKHYRVMLQELNNSVVTVENELKKYDAYVDNKSHELESLKAQEHALECENRRIVANVDKLNGKLDDLKISNNILKEQEQLAKDALSSIHCHIDTVRKSIADYELRLKNLGDEFARLKCDTPLNNDDAEINQDTERLLVKTNKIKADLENVTNQNGQLEKQYKQLKLELADLHVLKEELKCREDLYDVEYNFLSALSTQISMHVDEEHLKAEKKMGEKIEKCVENVMELSNIIIEKNMFLDAIKADIEKFNDIISSLEFKILAQNRENDDKKSKICQIKDSIVNEERSLQSKINLLEDLEKNTFPRNQIPSEWFQNFEKHRVAYERLKKERTELEEKHHKLMQSSKVDKEPQKKKVEMKLSDIFGDSKSKHLSTSEVKNAAFQIFKERIMKKDKIPLINKLN